MQGSSGGDTPRAARSLDLDDQGGIWAGQRDLALPGD